MKLKLPDLRLLTFLLLITAGFPPIKILGVLFAFLTMPADYLGPKKHPIVSFYWLLLCYAVAASLFFILNLNYLWSIVLTLSLLIFSMIASQQIYQRIEMAPKRVLLTADYYFSIIALCMFVQILYQSWKYKALITYTISQSAGDPLYAIFSVSSESMIILSFFLIFYLYRGKKWRAVLAFFLILMTGYMGGMFLFFTTFLLVYFFSWRLNFVKKILIFIFFPLITLSAFYQLSPSNVKYVLGYLRKINAPEDEVPYKIKSFLQTGEYLTSGVDNFIFGAGPGNFSSRTAFVVSGDYVNWFPQVMIYRSEVFDAYHFGLWIHDFGNPWDDRENAANQPFSFYNRLLGEYGFLGFLIFSFTYFRFCFKYSMRSLSSRIMFFCLLSYFIMDYWFEYLSVVVIFELLFLLNTKSIKTRFD